MRFYACMCLCVYGRVCVCVCVFWCVVFVPHAAHRSYLYRVIFQQVMTYICIYFLLLLLLSLSSITCTHVCISVVKKLRLGVTERERTTLNIFFRHPVFSKHTDTHTHTQTLNVRAHPSTRIRRHVKHENFIKRISHAHSAGRCRPQIKALVPVSGCRGRVGGMQ